MDRNKLALIVLAAIFFVDGEAISCFYRTGSTSSMGNGTALDCGGYYTYCYSYKSGQYNYAGCSTSNVCSDNEYPACVSCSTDYCNSLTATTAIKCYARSGSSDNGTMTNCSAGYSSCYSYQQYEANYYGGCGNCSAITDPSCVTCSTDYCNTATPSSISCYYRRASFSPYPGPGISASCQTGISSCYSYTDGQTTYGGCGKCGPNAQPCVTCSTNNCNTLLPSAISCYYRQNQYVYTGSTSNSNGSMTPCSTGLSTCYSYLFNPGNGYSLLSYAGCGACNSTGSSLYGCIACNTSNCNYLPSNISATTAGTAQTTASATTNANSNASQTTATATTNANSNASQTTATATTNANSNASQTTATATTNANSNASQTGATATTNANSNASQTGATATTNANSLTSKSSFTSTANINAKVNAAAATAGALMLALMQLP